MITTRARVIVALFAMLSLQGCFSSAVRASGPNGSRHSSAGASLFWGITTPTHGATQCTNGLKEVEMYRPWYSYLVALVTIGIVTPITSQWECMGDSRMGDSNSGENKAAPIAPAAMAPKS